MDEVIQEERGKGGGNSLRLTAQGRCTAECTAPPHPETATSAQCPGLPSGTLSGLTEKLDRDYFLFNQLVPEYFSNQLFFSRNNTCDFNIKYNLQST